MAAVFSEARELNHRSAHSQGESAAHPDGCERLSVDANPVSPNFVVNTVSKCNKDGCSPPGIDLLHGEDEHDEAALDMALEGEEAQMPKPRKAPQCPSTEEVAAHRIAGHATF